MYPTIAYGMWKYYGATGVAARHYPSLVEYMEMLERAVAGGIEKVFCQWGCVRGGR